MAIKYHRNQEEPEDPGRRETPFMRLGPSVPRMTRRQGTFVIFGFLISALLLGQFALRRAGLDPYAFQPVIRGEGTIVRTERGPDGRGVVLFEVAVEGKAPLGASWEIPDPYWGELAAGDRIAVVHQINHSGTALRVIECGIVALPDKIR